MNHPLQLRSIQAHNLRLRRVLLGAAFYGAVATVAAVWGWMR